MKTIFAAAILVLAVVSLAVSAGAYTGVALNVMPVCDGGSVHTVNLGWVTDDGTGHATTDGYDATWDARDTGPSSAMVEMDVINPAIAGNRVMFDYRAPITTASDYQIFRLKTYIPNTTYEQGTSFGLHTWFFTGYLPTDTQFWILDGDYRTQADCQAAAAGTALIYKLTPGNAAAGYSSGARTWDVAAPVYDAENDSYSTPSKYFTVYAEQIPEPSSVLAMFSGLIGLVAVGIRRRK